MVRWPWSCSTAGVTISRLARDRAFQERGEDFARWWVSSLSAARVDPVLDGSALLEVFEYLLEVAHRPDLGDEMFDREATCAKVLSRLGYGLGSEMEDPEDPQGALPHDIQGEGRLSTALAASEEEGCTILRGGLDGLSPDLGLTGALDNNVGAAVLGSG